MTTAQIAEFHADPVLHVFEQDGGWHWGITVPRALGSGFKVIAYSDRSFSKEDAARDDGSQVLGSLAYASHAMLAASLREQGA
ncbi:hypothetical protein [Paraburkholderia acidipaludis]|uniref:hypothetical protein n=1 Tax=Paraburkholderia acidipaludis TaxID=660537 RepID=UPI0004896BD7|nr:hypothetical protein [Paraburkholderia acidipaludis]